VFPRTSGTASIRRSVAAAFRGGRFFFDHCGRFFCYQPGLSRWRAIFPKRYDRVRDTHSTVPFRTLLLGRPSDNVNFARALNSPARSTAMLRSHVIPPVRLPCPRIVSAICTTPNCSGWLPSFCGRSKRTGITSSVGGLGPIIPRSCYAIRLGSHILLSTFPQTRPFTP
jgi:hypothetical protein